jgi:hypothetical protein
VRCRKAPVVAIALAGLAAGGASGCAMSSTGDSSATASHSSTSVTRSSGSRARLLAAHGGGLVASTASSHVVQPQPAPGRCHAKGSGDYSEPDPRCTPGALNPAVTQRTIDQTICVSGWSAKVRPSPSITDREKRASMAAYGDHGSPSDFEYDHLVSLELGGASNDPRNLWAEPGASPNPKDAVENALHRLVCDGQISLARAQRVIATDWVGWAKRNRGGAGAPGG